MNLTLFFRLILMSIFQHSTKLCKTSIGNPFNYDNQLFYCPRVFAKDGWNVSLQIHNGNYCSSENGYRFFGSTMEEVEFGYPSDNEPLMFKYSELYDEEDLDITDSVGRIPISIMEEVFEKHGGIDWEKTISIEQFNKMCN